MTGSTRQWWFWPGLLAVMLLAISCGDDDDGGGGGVTPQAPTPPEQFAFEEELLADPDVPAEVSGTAAMASGMMQMGQGYMAAAASGGTPTGSDCWEWSWVDGQTQDAILIAACEESGGAANWEVTLTQAGMAPCVVLRGEVASDGLSGSWAFRDCECDTTVLLTEWTTNAAGSVWTVDMTITPYDCAKRPSFLDEDDPIYVHYEANSDGSGSMNSRSGADTLWTSDWQISGDEISGTYCWYEDGVLQECSDFGAGGGELPEVPEQFEIDEDVIDTFEANLPDSALSVIGSMQNFQGMGEDWLEMVSGAGEQEDGCWVWRYNEQGANLEIWVCEEAGQICAEVKQTCESGGPLVTQMEMCEQTDGSLGTLTIYDCEGTILAHAVWEENASGATFTMTLTGGVFTYVENPDGSGQCSWTFLENIVWDCEWNAAYHGTYCSYGYLGGGDPDCFDF
ncbi:MAG: hypothetical protein GF330_08580 [Candidatus Eisenbacteria bacterium]|nr:hypothetical protein [Candidatus Eisenbacteria bacterium]